MGVTQKDIAERVGVDRSLVAHALRGNPRIAPATRQRILDVASEMGYTAHSNLEARSLIARRHGKKVETGEIAVLLGDPLEGKSLHNMPFFGDIFRGIADEAGKRGKEVSYHFLRPGHIPRMVTSKKVDGVISIYSRTISRDLKTHEVDLPAVRLDGYDPADWNIHPDNYHGAYTLTQHLIELGHRQIAFMGRLPGKFPLHQAQVTRLEAYQAALQAAGITIEPRLIYGDLEAFDEEIGYEALKELLRTAPKFTALVCGNDAAAMGAVKAALAAGLRVPEDISITGFDGLDFPTWENPAVLTTAVFDRYLMGRRAIQLLDECATAENNNGHQELLPVTIRQGTTTGKIKVSELVTSESTP